MESILNHMKIIGYTTGVYDLFHIGHLNILRRAKEHCNHLIVGVSTDKLVQFKKNKRPIVPYEERAEIVRAIRYVDEVKVQEDLDKFAAWQRYQFHKIFVGSDWQGTAEWDKYEKKFAEVGVEVVYFPYTHHTSSTILRKALDALQ